MNMRGIQTQTCAERGVGGHTVHYALSQTSRTIVVQMSNTGQLLAQYWCAVFQPLGWFFLHFSPVLVILSKSVADQLLEFPFKLSLRVLYVE